MEVNGIVLDIDKCTMDMFLKVMDIVGKSPDDAIEEAIKQYIQPFLTYDYKIGEGKYSFNPQEATYVDEERKIRDKCYILERSYLLGQEYCRIVKNGQLYKVPSKYIELPA